MKTLILTLILAVPDSEVNVLTLLPNMEIRKKQETATIQMKLFCMLYIIG